MIRADQCRIFGADADTNIKDEENFENQYLGCQNILDLN